jgi:hypothetical protein
VRKRRSCPVSLKVSPSSFLVSRPSAIELTNPFLPVDTTPTFNAAPSSLTTSEAAPSPHGSKTALEIYALFQSSSEITLKPYDPDAMINARLREAIEGQNGPELRKLVGMWRLEGKRDDEVVNELLVLGALAAGATGRLGRETRIDFFMVCIFQVFALYDFFADAFPLGLLLV